MDRTIKQAIESFAWDCTVGIGGDPDDRSDEPDADSLDALSRYLGRHLTISDVELFTTCWSQGLQSMRQP